MSWADSKVYVGLSRKAIKNGPTYDESTPITREYEDRLYLHYGQPPYWLQEARGPSAIRRACLPATVDEPGCQAIIDPPLGGRDS